MVEVTVATDFDAGLLEATGHRPWPLPGAPWIMRQSWHNLLFAHWPVGHEDLRRHVPRVLELDTFDGQAWLGITPFTLTNVALRLTPPFPWISAFAEINVRTYVTVNGKPGVYFFSLDANSVLAVWAARLLFNLPYHAAEISVELTPRTIVYNSCRSARPSATFEARYEPSGTAFCAAAGTLDHWLTERYCLYTVESASTVHHVQIHHRPWSLQPARAEVVFNTMAEAAGLRLPSAEPLLLFGRRLDVLVWAPAPAGPGAGDR